MLAPPTTLSEERQQELRQSFDRYFGDRLTGLNVRVLFYNSTAFGANAFALPDGSLIFTDQFVELVNEDEFLAVAAHEIGHVRHDHSIRSIIGSSTLVAATLLITGDSEAISEIIVTAPYALAQLAYSRDMEQEADTAALQLMQAAGLDRQAFASALRKMMDSHGAGQKDSKVWDEYLSSHPATDQRIKRFE
ncbi:M48 family metallopeptidase [Saccharospirillum mangrovi]|uniref:M48 family metallopeptidase n=1 Tax=Saccharospirillum mangrovi TaxID=2161747 RepID=UPI000D36B7C4|nr:M48 family metallopeptidase [Saccharospirillum mangrovi]